MANVYTLILNSIGVDPDDNTKLKTLSTTVTRTQGTADITTLFKVFNASNDTAIPVTVTNSSGDNYLVTFNTSLDNTESIHVQINDDPNYSDRMFIDFNAAVTNGSIDLTYKIPSEAGDYKMTLDIPNVTTFDSVSTTDSLSVSSTKPDHTESSVSFYNTKPYLTHFVGDTITLRATIHDSASADADGNYEFSISGNLQ